MERKKIDQTEYRANLEKASYPARRYFLARTAFILSVCATLMMSIVAVKNFHTDYNYISLIILAISIVCSMISFGCYFANKIDI